MRTKNLCYTRGASDDFDGHYDSHFGFQHQYIPYDENCVKRAQEFFQNQTYFDNLKCVLKRSRNCDSASGASQHVVPGARSASSRDDLSLSLMEYAFSKFGALTNDINMRGIYEDCISSKGKKLFDAFKRRSSYNVLLNGLCVQTNLAQIRWTMFACRHNLFDFIRANVGHIQGKFNEHRARNKLNAKRRHSAIAADGEGGTRAPSSANAGRKGRRRRDKIRCHGCANTRL
jgi:hypothetical protein